MKKYGWDLKEIKDKQRYMIERLKCNVDSLEKEKLETSLVSLIVLLNNSGSVRYTRFYNFMDRLTKDQFSLKKNSHYGEIELKLLQENVDKIDKNYLKFLLDITDNLAVTDKSDVNFDSMYMDDEELIMLSKNFYKQLGDNEIQRLSEKVLENPTALNITSIKHHSFENFGGITIQDSVFNKAYCNVARDNSIFDAQVINHEVMHAIDFYMHPKLLSQNYYGFHEVPTYTIDYLFLDYLEEMGFDQEEVNKLRQQKFEYITLLATMTKQKIKSALIQQKGLKVSINPTIEDINEVINFPIKKQLLEIQSGVMAYGLSTQIKENKTMGISSLKTFMKNDITKNQRPNFSNIGLSDDYLMTLSKQFINQKSNNIESEIEVKKAK